MCVLLRLLDFQYSEVEIDAEIQTGSKCTVKNIQSLTESECLVECKKQLQFCLGYSYNEITKQCATVAGCDPIPLKKMRNAHTYKISTIFTLSSISDIVLQSLFLNYFILLQTENHQHLCRSVIIFPFYLQGEFRFCTLQDVWNMQHCHISHSNNAFWTLFRHI